MNIENLYLSIINNLREGVYFVNPDREIIFWNKAAEEITGYISEEMIGKKCQHSLLRHIDREGKPLCTIGCPLFFTIIDGKQRKQEIFLRHKNGHRIPVQVNIFPITENNEIVGAVEIFAASSSITYEDDLIEKLSEMAMNDQLTGLSNRRKTQSYLEYKICELKRFQRKICVIFIDIDNFRNFNNNYGHETGDVILMNIARTMNLNMKVNDLFGRWGGEEFIAICEVSREDEAIEIAEKIRILIESTEIACEDKNLFVTVSLGVTLACVEDTVEGIVERADNLMYQSKSKGKNCVTSDILKK
ncbi:MAG: sensor domain-containing diguanylate cyclase [Anaerotignum sp.]|nr:sensor domain-containing diguanylate cyclase [Anaerotignum sp.]